MPVQGFDLPQSSHDSRAQGVESRVVPEQEVRRARLVRVIETELVPRLMLSVIHRTQNPGPSPAIPESASAMVATFAGLLTVGDRLSCIAFVQSLREGGVPLARTYVDLIAPTARYLYVRWQHGESSLRNLLAELIQLIAIMRAVSAREQGQRRRDISGSASEL